MSAYLRLIGIGVLLACALVVPRQAASQATSLSSEQISLFRSLSPQDQQRLIQEVLNQVPQSERDAILSSFISSDAADSSTGAASSEVAPAASELEDQESEDVATGQTLRLAAGDTLVVEFAYSESLASLEERQDTSEFLARLQGANPYQLDSEGQLYLPGIQPISLAGLTVSQAETRLSTESSLASLEFDITQLPLDPVGTSALKLDGQELFRASAAEFMRTSSNLPVPEDYVVGVGDTLVIQLFGNRSGLYNLTVNRDGAIDFPEIGPVQVSGVQFDEVRTLLGELVAEQMLEARVSVRLGELRSISVWLAGEVVRPGLISISSLATVTNAIVAGGGITEIGSLRNISVMRNGEPVAVLDLYDLLLQGDTSGDSRLQSGDVILVSTLGPTVAVSGQVLRPAIYELSGDQSVEEVIRLAGGLRADADPTSVRLERVISGRGVAVNNLNVSGSDAGTLLRNGDVIFVDRSLGMIEDSITLLGNVQRSGLYEWHPGMTIGDLLPDSELVKPDSDLGYVLIQRERRPNMELEVISADLLSIWLEDPGFVDIELEPRDTVYVFHRETGRQQYIQPIVDAIGTRTIRGEASPIVRIQGEISSEGEYPLEADMRISDLLRAGGGLTDAAYSIEAELTRYHVMDGEYRIISIERVSLEEVLAGNSAADLELLPYDLLSVREISGWNDLANVSLRGEFRFPGEYRIRPGESLDSVIARAGGLTDSAFAEGSVFTREGAKEREAARLEREAQRVETSLASMALSDPDGGAETIDAGQALLGQLRSLEPTGRTVIRLDELVAGASGVSIEMQDGDVLFVPKRSNEVTVIGEVQYPTSHIFDAALTRNDYIARSGGLTGMADKQRVYVIRANGEVVIDSGIRWFERGGSMQIRPGDTIVAPLEISRLRPLELWSSVTQIIYNLAVATAAVGSF